jgi:hypothetical protein
MVAKMGVKSLSFKLSLAKPTEIGVLEREFYNEQWAKGNKHMGEISLSKECSDN